MTAVTQSDFQWGCSRSADFSLRQWSDGAVLFDDASGQLKCLTPASGAVMALLMGRMHWTSVELAEELMEDAPTEDDVKLIENVLHHFQSLKLIDRS